MSRATVIPLLVVLVAVVVAAQVASVVPEKRGGVRVVWDGWDVAQFAQRGSWAMRPGARPYKDEPSEYPQLATYFFGVPYLFTHAPEGYRFVWYWLMAACLAATAAIAARVCSLTGMRPARVLFLVLPGTLYFSLNRYDILVAVLSLAACWQLLRKRPMVAHGLLGAAVLTKVYPAIYLPLFLVWTWRTRGRRAAIKGAAAFMLVILACSAQLILWTDGSLRPVVEPLRGQAMLYNNQSLYHVVGTLLHLDMPSAILKRGFQLLLIGLVAATITRRPATPMDLLRSATVLTLGMILLAPAHSPQWMVWVTPLALACCVTRVEVALLVASELLTYLYFPIAFDAYGPRSMAFAVVVDIYIVVRLVLLAALLRRAAPLRGTHAE